MHLFLIHIDFYFYITWDVVESGWIQAMSHRIFCPFIGCAHGGQRIGPGTGSITGVGGAGSTEIGGSGIGSTVGGGGSTEIGGSGIGSTVGGSTAIGGRSGSQAYKHLPRGQLPHGGNIAEASHPRLAKFKHSSTASAALATNTFILTCVGMKNSTNVKWFIFCIVA